ncbi:hypothetical protein [Cellulomonas endometrii]|nr:hypothetical protein [Cellulomonas endometrii]
MTTPQHETTPPTGTAAPHRTREQTAWWTVFAVLTLSVVLMLGLWD